jgi:transcriptional regulator with XRE-family HTH domain
MTTKMTKEERKEFGLMIKNKRKELHITQRKCAFDCEISPVSLQSWEQGNCNIKKDNLVRICEYLGIPEPDCED